jgi:hypothetical protein
VRRQRSSMFVLPDQFGRLTLSEPDNSFDIIESDPVIIPLNYRLLPRTLSIPYSPLFRRTLDF